MFVFQWIRYSNLFIWFLVKKGVTNYVRTQLVGDGESSKIRAAVYRVRGCQVSCLRTHLHYVFGSIFVLQRLDLFVEI